MFRVTVWLMMTFCLHAQISNGNKANDKHTDAHARQMEYDQDFNFSDNDSEQRSRRTAEGRVTLHDFFTVFGVRPDLQRPSQSSSLATTTVRAPLKESTDENIRNSDPFYMKPKAKQVNCTSVGVNCKDCTYIDWLEIYNKTIDDSVRATKYSNFDGKECFRQCATTNSCVLHTFDQLNRICKIYVDLRSAQIKNDTNSSMFVRISPYFIFLSEWIVSRDRVPRGKALRIAKVTDFFECITLCSNQDKCVFATLNRSKNTCRIYSRDATRTMELIGNHVSIQHISLLRDDNIWRFEDVGYVYQRNKSKVAFTTANFENCLDFCSRKESCNLATSFASNTSTVDCFIYEHFENVWFEDNPRTKARRSFYKVVSRNNTKFRKLPPYVTVASTIKPIEMKRSVNLNGCHRQAMNNTSCYWYSYNSTSQICKIYNSIVQMRSVKRFNQTDLATYSKSIPTKYIPFYGFQLVWLPDDVLYNISTIGQSSGNQCLEKCLDLENCTGVAIQMPQQNCSLYSTSSLTGILHKFNKIDDIGLQTIQMYLKTGDPRLIRSEKQFRCLNNSLITWDDINQILQSKSLDTIRSNIPLGNNLPLAPHGSSFEGNRNGTAKQITRRQSNVARWFISAETVKKILTLAASAGASVGSLTPVGTLGGTALGVLGGLAYVIVCGLAECGKKPDSCQKRCGFPADHDQSSTAFLKLISSKSTNCICESEPGVSEGGNLMTVVGDKLEENQVPLQENCTGKSVGEVCEICCGVGYKAEKNPACTCSIESNNYWKPEPVQCVPSTQCSIGSSTWEGKDMPALRVADCKGNLYYGLVFNTAKKLPFFTIHHFNEINAVVNPRLARTPWEALACTDIETSQYTDDDYDDLKTKYFKPSFDKGHLVPHADIRYRKDGVIATMVYANAAPQDGYANKGPWNQIEQRLRKLFLEKYTEQKIRQGYVIAGVCLSDHPEESEVPSCFWKMACTRTDSGIVTVAVFYHTNNLTFTQQDRDDRKDELYVLRDMRSISNKFGNFDLEDVWATSEAFFPDDPGYIGYCKDATSIDFPVIFKPKAAPDYTLYNFWMKKIFYEQFNDTVADTEEDDTFGLNESGSPPSCGTKVVGYVSGWSDVKFTFSAASYLSHVIFAFIQMKSDGTLVVGSADPDNTKDAYVDMMKSYLRLYEIRAAKEESGYRLRTIFAVGGWENSQFFPATAGNAQFTQNFIRTAIGILDYFNMDGIDIDWEYPVTGGAREGSKQDRENYVSFLDSIKRALANHQESIGRTEPYSLTIAGAAGSWVLEDGFDLPAIADIVDWINVMTYDYNGAWDSKWGAYTGPHAPLYFGAPEGYSGKTNVDYTMKYYSCRIQDPSKLVMGLGFYGRYWNSTGSPVGKNPVWRMANQNAAEKFDGGFEPWRNIVENYLSNLSFDKHFDKKTQTPYLDHPSGFLMGYEDTRSIHEKVKYASAKGFAGVMIWAVDLDDDRNTLLRMVSSESLCSGASEEISPEYKCPPIQEQRWWTLLDDKDKAGMCGKSAPLYKGYYPVCDPEDPGYACCSASGYCGSGDKFCKCDGCVDYFENPEKILDEPIKPSTPVRWHTMDKFQSGPQCGYLGHRLENGQFAICNPDDGNGYCCSAAGYCGKKSESCDCEGCVNFKNNPNFVYPEKTWIDSGSDAGKCGKNAQVNGKPATCNPLSKNYYCCSKSGYCGAGTEYCDCDGCVNYKKK